MSAFDSFPHVAPLDNLNRTGSRKLRVRLIGLIVIAAIGASGSAAYFSGGHSKIVPTDSPHVIVEVTGLHCPIQCGLRVSKALKSIPYVLSESVTANPKTGNVTFSVSEPALIDEVEIRRAIESAGFGVRAIRLTSASVGH